MSMANWPLGKVRTRPLSGSGPQNTVSQILLIESRVISPAPSATAAVSASPWSMAAWTRSGLAQKPENGGRPASDRPLTRNV